MRYLSQFLLSIVIALTACASGALANCPEHQVRRAEQVRLTGDSVLFVVHASSTYDARFTSKRGVDEAVRFAKQRGIQVVYLQDDSPEQFYFMQDCSPSLWLYSQGGELNLEKVPAHVYIAGGHLELCMAVALNEIIFNWKRKATGNLTVTYLMDAIYSNGKLIEASDPFYADFHRFMEVVTYGRPGGEHWPKLSLLETMGLIVREDRQLQYLEHVLPRWDNTFPGQYQVELSLNGERKKVLRKASGLMPPTLRFEFYDSALSIDPIR
jgi:hypothetical protein